MNRAFHILAMALLSTASMDALAGEPGALDLDGLVDEAVRNEPGLRRMRALSEAAGEVPSQVASLPDPVVMLGASNFRLDDPGLGTSPMTGVVVGVAQLVPSPIKLVRRKELAWSAHRLAEAGVLQASTAVKLDVEQKYWALWLSQESERIFQERTEILDDLAAVVTARFSVGQGAQQDALQVQAAQSQMTALLAERSQERVTALRALNESVGRPPGAESGSASAPPEPEAVDADALRARLIGNPDVVAADARVDVAEAAVSEARAGLAPDFAVGVDYRVRGVVPNDLSRGADMISGSLRVIVPLWAGTKQGARVREQRARLIAAQAGREDVELLALRKLESVLDVLTRLDAEIDIQRAQVLPAADAALASSIDDYSEGRVAFVSVLQNWSSTLQAELTLHQLRAHRAQSLSLVEALVGDIQETP